MDHHDGGYGYPPNEEDPRDNNRNPGDPRAYRDDPASYGADASQQYTRDANAYHQGYDPDTSGYVDPSHPVNPAQPGYTDAENPFAPRPIDPNYGYDYQQPAGDGYQTRQDYPQQPVSDGYDAQPHSERYYDDPNYPYTPRPQPTDYSRQTDYSQYGAVDNSPYSAEEPGSEYHPMRRAARTPVSPEDDRYGYTPRGNTGRMRIPDDVEEYTPRGATGRTRYPDSEDRYTREVGDEMDFYEHEPPRHKKKRSKFGKFMHALGLYLAQLPSRTLIIIGGSFVMVMAAVILLAVLLPNINRDNRADDGQLALTDITPVPSLAPTDTPVPTEEVTPTPELPPLTENIAVVGTISDLIPAIQERLVELGYMEEPDGGYTTKYGPATKTAIRLFQVKNFADSKDWDGIIGNGTYTLLMSDDAKAYYLTRGDGDDRTKVITKLVEDVTKLQNRLIELGYLTPGSATGLYGNTTVLAVQKFQEYHGLEDDGKAGQETLTLIYSSSAMDAATGAANNLSKVTPAPATSPSDTETTPAP